MAVMENLLASGKVSTDTQIIGFFRITEGVGALQRRVAIEPRAFVQTVLRHAQSLFGHYNQALMQFWSTSGPESYEASRRDALLHFRSNQLAVEASLRRADNVIDSTQGICAEGLALVQGATGRANAFSTSPSMYRLSVRVEERDIGLSGVFVLAPKGDLSTVGPLLLYTPQRGLERFSSYAALRNELSLRSVTLENDEILLNIPSIDYEHVSSALKGSQGRWALTELMPDTVGNLLGQVLDEQLALQRVNLYAAFLPFRPGIQGRLPAVLALPQGLPADLLRMPVRADTLPLIAPSGLSVGDQQIHWMHKLDALNALTGNLLSALPSFNVFFQERLGQMFPSLSAPIDAGAIYYTRYRIDEFGAKHRLSSMALDLMLTSLLVDERDVAQSDGAFASRFYLQPNTLDDNHLIRHVGTFDDLAVALKTGFQSRVEDFWGSLQAGRGPQRELLVRVRKQILATLAVLGTIDGTLTPGSRALIDAVLRYPTKTARATAFLDEPCPQVYGLCMADGTRFAGVFILSPDSSNPPAGTVVLYTQGEGFEEYSNLQEMLAALVLRLDEGDSAGGLLASSLPNKVVRALVAGWRGQRTIALCPVYDDFVFDSVRSLLSKQLQDVAFVLGSDKALVAGTVQRGLDLALHLDVADAFVARNRRLELHETPVWIRSLSRADRQRLERDEQAAQEKNQLLGALLEGIPSLGSYTREKLRDKLREFLDGRGLHSVSVRDIDPDRVKVIQSEWVRLHHVPVPGVTPVYEKTYTTEYSLTELALKNLSPWEKSLSWTSKDALGAVLTYADGRPVIDSQGATVKLYRELLEGWVNALNIGHRYMEDIFKRRFDVATAQGEAHFLREAWLDAQAATLKYEVGLAALSPIAYRTPSSNNPSKKRAAQWMSVVLASPKAAHRTKVDGLAVVVSHLALGKPGTSPMNGGSQLVHGVFIVSVADQPQMVLYASGAPDERVIREVLSEAHLRKLLMQPRWQAYLRERLAVSDPRLISLVLTPTHGMEMRLVPCDTPLLPEMYRLMVARMKLHVEKGAVSNEQLSRRSTLNKVLFGIEVAGHLLDMMPWATHWMSKALGRWVSLARTAVQTFRARGQNIPGLIVRQGRAGRILTMEAAAQSAGQTVAAGIRPLPVRAPLMAWQAGMVAQPALQVPRAVRLSSFIPRAWESSAVPSPEAQTLMRGLEPNSRDIYRTEAGEYLIRPSDALGNERVYRIKGDFRLYGEGDLTVQVIDAHSRMEVGLLKQPGRGQWMPVSLKGSGVGSSTLGGLPNHEYLHTPAYARREHQVSSLSSIQRKVYQAWFNRDMKRFFSRVMLRPRPAPLSVGPTTTVDELIERVFAQSDGLVIGEAHNEIASVNFFLEKMQVLKRHGVRTLYVEGLSATDQPYRRIRGSDPRYQVCRAAQEQGISVRGLDDNLLTFHLDPRTGIGRVDLSKKRLPEMNYFGVREIERCHPRDGGKWVAWVGAAHMNTSEGVPGLAELTATVGVWVRNVKPGRSVGVTIPARRTASGVLADMQVGYVPGML